VRCISIATVKLTKYLTEHDYFGKPGRCAGVHMAYALLRSSDDFQAARHGQGPGQIPTPIGVLK
jgi:hypothetical protein